MLISRLVIPISIGCLTLLAACSPQAQGGGSASIARTLAPTSSPGASASPQAGDSGNGQPSPASSEANGQPAPGESSGASPGATPSPSSTSASASATPTPKALGDYRASGLWHDLGTAQQAGGIVGTVMKWRNPEGAIGPMPNGEALWSQVMPPLRDHLLTRHIEHGVIPTPVFAGTPYQTPQSVRVVTWWTNGPGGTGGRGQLFMVFAGWKSAEGIDHIDMWPVLIGFGAGGEGQFKAGRVNAVGPLITMPVAELNVDQGAAFAAISAQVHPWMQSQPVSEDPLDLPCPQQGCST